MSDKVKQFQKKNGLIPDGIIGKNTALKMSEVWGLTSVQLAHFLGQGAHESLNFTKDTENLNYSAEALLKVFRKYFTKAAARIYEYNPHMVGRFVYADRMGNGGIDTIDGWQFRGRGILMLTGRNNYTDFAKYIKDDRVINNPELVATEYYFESGLYFFYKNNIFKLATNFDVSTINGITKRINGGYNGIKDRTQKTMHFKKLLGL